MQLSKKRKTKKGLDGLLKSPNKDTDEKVKSVSDSISESVPDSVIDDSVSEITHNLSANKSRKVRERVWGDRPEHLRKGLSEMTADEKKEYYLWKAGENTTENSESLVSKFGESEIAAIGAVILPFLAKRMPNSIPPSNEEITSFGKVMTPLANKYLIDFGYKEELNGALFLLAFALPRMIRSDAMTEVNLEDIKG